MRKFDPTRLVETQPLRTVTLLRVTELILLVIVVLLPAVAVMMLADIDLTGDYLVPAVAGGILYLLVAAAGFFLFHRSVMMARHRYNLICEELEWKNLIISHTNEIIMLLDTLGRVITFNPALTKLLHFEREDLIKKPFRSILYDKSFEDNIQLKDLLLCRFRDVFIGNEADMMLPCSVKNTSRVHTIAFKMIPILLKNELQYILVVGRATQSDILTGKYLKSESSRYVIGNNVSLVNLLTYRMTRNLENRIDQAEIIRMQLGLQEVIINAIEHGNLGIDFKTKTELRKKKGNYWELMLSVTNKKDLQERTIDISHQMDEEKVVYVIKDQGEGFDWEYYLNLEPGNINTELLESFHGIGLQMVKSVFDISFNEKGNEITLVKYLDNGEENEGIQEPGTNG